MREVSGVSALSVSGLTVAYRDTVALENVDLELGEGTVCGLIGVNGSGKTTLLRSVLGLVRPDSGTVRIAGESSLAARRAQAVAYVPQSDSIDTTFPLDVRGVVEQGRYGHLGATRRLRAADRELVESAIARVGLSPLASRPIGALSGGQRKRAFVARALAHGGRLLLLDEPFAGVDRGSQQTITSVLRDVAAAGATVIVSTHDLEHLAELCDEAVLLHRRVLAHGAPDAVLRPDVLVRAFGGGTERG